MVRVAADIPNTDWANNLPVELVPKVLSQLAALQAALAARLAMAPRQPAALDDALVDAPTLAKRLGVPESHVRTLQRTGAIPHVRVGVKYVRFCVAEVEAALAAKS